MRQSEFEQQQQDVDDNVVGIVMSKVREIWDKLSINFVSEHKACQ